MLADLQRDLADWLLRGHREPAARWLAPGVPPSRLDIHRNTVLGLLAEVLAAAFPVTRLVVGEEFFEGAARLFAADQPPDRPALWAWGGGFPDFLSAFPPAAALPYLPDLARLEWAMHSACFAADAEALDLGLLTAQPPEALVGLAFQPHPSVALLRSPWPVHSLWAAHQPDGSLDRLPAEGEAVLIQRREAGVTPRPLDPWRADFVAALVANTPLGAAFAACPVSPALVQEELARLLTDGVFVGYAFAAASTPHPPEEVA